MIRKTLPFIFFMLSTLCVSAYKRDLSTAVSPHTKVLPQQDSASRTLALGVHVGSTGAGLHVKGAMGKRFGWHVGASIMPFKTHIQGTHGGRATDSDIRVQAHHASVLLTWYPAADLTGGIRKLNVQGGIAYFFKLEAEAATTLKDGYQHGDIMVDPSYIGVVTTTVRYKPISPYLGIGYQDIRLGEKLSLRLDVGSYYLSPPEVSMNATGLLEANINNKDIIQNNIKNYRFMPRIEVGLSYPIR